MDVFVREKAAEALGKIGDSSAVPALIKALNDKYGFISRNADGTLSGEKRSVCESAAIALIKIGEPAVPALVKALFYGDSNVRENIAVALKKSGDSRVVSVLIEALGSKNSDVRKNAAYVLGEIGDPCAVPALTKALDDEDGLVHESAAIALGEIGDSQAVPALIKALDDKDMYSRKNSANELAKIGKPTVDPLIKVLSNENEDVRLSAVVVLIKIGEPAVPALKRALGDKDSNVRKNAAYVLKKLGDTSEVPALIKELSNKHSRVRENAADMLGEIGDPRAVFALIKVLGDVERSVREKATNALAKIGKRAAQALIKALGNADNCVRKNAAVALGKIGAPLAVRALIETLSDVDSGVRKNAAVALGELSDPRAVRALTKALDDEDIRSVAADALKKIRNKKVVPMLTKPLSDVDGGLRRNAAYVLKKIDQPREKDGRYDQKPGGSPEDVWKKITGNETLKALAANGKLTVKKYREVDSSVSESTNRRDFRKLVEEGKLLPVGRVKEGNTYRFTVPARPAFELDYEEILSEDGPWNYGFLIPHVRRATAIGMRVGEELGLSEERLKLLEYVLLLHDVGAGIRGRYPDVFSSMTGKVEESFRKVFPSKKYISLKLALDDLMGHKAESEGLDIATADDDTRNRLLEKVLEGSLAREMTPEEKEVAYSMRGVAENSLRILKKQGIEVSKDLKAIIRYHNDYNGFKTEEGLTLSEEEAKLLITIMYIADVFEHGNNYHSRKGDIAPFGKTVAFMESKFAGEEIKDRRAIDALCSLLGREDKVILNTAANGRATVAIGPEDKQFMEEQALRSASRLMMKEKGKKFTRERKADGAPGQLLKIKAERLIVINDLHSELAALDAIINEVESDPGIYDEIRSGRTQIVLLGDFMQTMNEKDFEGYRESSDEFRWMSYESYKRSAGKRVYDLIVRVAELKIKYGDSFHVLPGNSELGFLYKRAYKELEKIISGNPELLDAIKDFSNSLPLFAIVEMTGNGRRYLLSHGGFVQSPDMEQQVLSEEQLKEYPRHRADESRFVEEWGSRRERAIDEVEVKKSYWVSNFYGRNKDLDETDKVVRKNCEDLGVTAQICGHVHIFGEKRETEVRGLGIALQDVDGAGISYGIAHDGKMHVINSLPFNNKFAYLEIGTDGIKPKAVNEYAIKLTAFLTNAERAVRPKEADVLLVLGSPDEGMARSAAKLFKEGNFKHVLCSGGGHIGEMSEAARFKEIMAAEGVPEEVFLPLEDKSRYMLDNFNKSREVLKRVMADDLIDNVKTIAVVQKPLDLKLAGIYFEQAFGEERPGVEGRFYAVNMENYSKEADIEAGILALGSNRLSGFIDEVSMPDEVRRYIDKMLRRKIEEIGAHSDARAGAKMKIGELEDIKKLIDESHFLIVLNKEYGVEFKRLYSDVLAGEKSATDLLEFFRQHTLLRKINTGRSKDWDLRKRTEDGDGVWGPRIGQQAEKYGEDRSKLPVKLDRAEHMRYMVDAGEKLIAGDLDQFTASLYARHTGNEEVPAEDDGGTKPDLEIGSLRSLMTDLGVDALGAEEKTVLKLGLSLHDYGRLMEGEKTAINTETGKLSVSDNMYGLMHRDSGVYLADRLMKSLGIKDDRAGIVKFLIKHHASFWDIYAGKYGKSYMVETSVDGMTDDLAALLDNLRDQQLMPEEMTRQKLADTLLAMLAVVTISDVYASGDRYLSDSFFKKIRETISSVKAGLAVEDPRKVKDAAGTSGRIPRLFKAVKKHNNNRRDIMVEKGKMLIGSVNTLSGSDRVDLVGREMSAAVIIDRLEKAIEAAQNMSIPDAGISSFAAEIEEGLDRLEADGIAVSVITLARKAIRKQLRTADGEKGTNKTVIALETDWIEGDLQHGAIDPLLALIRKVLMDLGMDNVAVVHKRKKETLEAWADSISDELVDKDDFSSVVVLGSREATAFFDKNKLTKVDPEKRAFLAGIDTSKLKSFYKENRELYDKQLVIEIMRMLLIALELASGDNAPDLPIIVKGSYDPVLRKVLFLPNAKAMEYGKIVSRYNAKLDVLKAL